MPITSRRSLSLHGCPHSLTFATQPTRTRTRRENAIAHRQHIAFMTVYRRFLTI
jgi:hypothetical protein